MNTENNIPIFFACDNNFMKFTIVSLMSLMQNASKKYTYDIHILHNDVDKETQDCVTALSDDTFHITFTNMIPALKALGKDFPLRDYYSKTTYYRMFIATMYTEYEKALYIDSDTVILDDISKLYNVELGDTYVGAAHEQAMVQEEVFGTYVEKVLGIDRNQFFNAGVLLINCRQFRKNVILQQFATLLDTYNFVVTQDEDYLNLLCKDKVTWLDQRWNTEVFGNIPYPESEFKLIHYIMVSKPWHYNDCKYGEYFWKYAKETWVYDEIKAILDNYTDEERDNDALSADRLKKTAIYETKKEHNYLNLLKNPTNKSKDRLAILDKIAKYEREGRFDEDVEDDPPTKELKPDDIDYLRKKPINKIKRKAAFFMARKAVKTLIKENKLIIKEYKGIKNYKSLNSGAVITCNHFNAFDSYIMELAYYKSKQKGRTFYRIIREGNYTNFPGFYGMLMRNCNTLPLSSNKETMKKFLKSIKVLLNKGDFLLVYPEQSMWWNYKKPKPLKKSAFSFAVKNNVPVLPCFITMEDSPYIGDDGFNIQEYTVHIAPPIYPDPEKSINENIKFMMDENFRIWKEIYEDTYKTKLSYEP